MGMIWPKLIAPSGGGIIEFVGGAIGQKASTSNTTLSLSSGLTGGIASSVSEGDLVIAAFSVAATSDLTLSITDGTNPYTLFGSELYSNDTYDTNLRVAYKFMGSTPDATTTFGSTGSSSNGGAYVVYVFRGVDPVVNDVAVTSITETDASTPTPADIEPVTAGAYIVVVAGIAHAGATKTFSSPSDLIGFFTAGQNATNDGSIGIGHKADWVSGNFSPEEWTSPTGTSATHSSAAITIALRPA